MNEKEKIAKKMKTFKIVIIFLQFLNLVCLGGYFFIDFYFVSSFEYMTTLKIIESIIIVLFSISNLSTLFVILKSKKLKSILIISIRSIK